LDVFPYNTTGKGTIIESRIKGENIFIIN